jgi:FkbM family methyltransferase
VVKVCSCLCENGDRVCGKGLQGVALPSGQTLLGKILRAPLSLIPAESEVRILRGPLRGKKWVVGASSHECWAGSYEVDELSAFAAAIQSGACVYDIGANVGIYTLMASMAAGPDGNVYAFEPVERNLRYLRRHVDLNRMRNVSVIDAAVSDAPGMQRFSLTSWDHRMGRLSSDGEVGVRVVSIDASVVDDKSLRAPDVMKIDVEGAELRVLQGADRVVREFHPSIFLEVHGEREHSECREFLEARGYVVKEGFGRLVALRDRRSAAGELRVPSTRIVSKALSVWFRGIGRRKM